MTDTEKLTKLLNITSIKDFFFYAAQEPDLFAAVNWEHLLRDKYPSYYQAVQKLSLASTYSYLDLYSWIMDFKDTFRSERALQQVAEFQNDILTLQHRIAWLLYNTINDRYHQYVVLNDDAYTLIKLSPLLNDAQRKALLPLARSQQISKIIASQKEAGPSVS